ncbi:CHCH domain containing protein [Plasmodium gonderi]|uniref:CHCH domain containing protein n=1 Tax=Plasmodium gonderi TaxID=77519 RepID=A0A1Y1JUZ0_PLAGO|nr:CHCH domain containing protein [Plasmodium gonderi]GAW83724.1 CHCH domain containing protein [Plasmodium gonderi]
MGRSSKSRSGGLSSRSSFLKPNSSSGVSRGNATSAQSYSGGAMQPQQKSGGLVSNMMGTVASGMASGVGFGIAQRAVDAILGPRHVEVSHQNNNTQMNQAAAMNTERNSDYKCKSFKDELNQCLTRHADISLCQNYADSLKSCQQSM